MNRSTKKESTNVALQLLPTDRIVAINDIRFMVTHDHVPSRRNVHCTSEKFKQILSESGPNVDNGLPVDPHQLFFQHLSQLDDIRVIRVTFG